jgi:DNA-binding transcriptional ArsR family regulator
MLCFYNMSTSLDQDLVFKALADRRRRQILDLIKEEPKTTGELCEYFKEYDRCTVMQHLGVLERAGLIIVKRAGRLRWNYLNAVPIREIYDRWINQYASPAVELLTKISRDMNKNKDRLD